MTASTPIKVRFLHENKELDAEIGQSLLDLALAHHIELDHACGGVCACSTCHVKITSGQDAFDPASEDEEDQLDEARDISLDSRLGCQAVIQRPPSGGVVEVSVPAWNVNLAQEGH